MIRELFQVRETTTSLNITSNRVDSIMKKSILKSGCRVYDNGFIGVAGTLGEPDETIWKEAREGVDSGIVYELNPETGERERDLRRPALPDKRFISDVEEILNLLTSGFPGFTFSNKLKCVETDTRLSNDNGLNYISMDRYYETTILVRKPGSKSIFDTGIMYNSREFDSNALYNEAKDQLSAYNRRVNLPCGDKVPVIMLPYELMRKFSSDLRGDMFGRNASMFRGNLGKKLFASDFTLYMDRSEEMIGVPFFDKEGSTLEGDKTALIKDGVLLSPYSDKLSAKRYGYPCTAAAGGDYDEVPLIASSYNLSVKPSERTLSDLLGGELGILAGMAIGGDWTNEGNYATPVQIAYLFDGKSFIGRLPELNISGNIYEMLGDDFIGVSADRPVFGERVLVTRMKVSENV